MLPLCLEFALLCLVHQDFHGIPSCLRTLLQEGAEGLLEGPEALPGGGTRLPEDAQTSNPRTRLMVAEVCLNEDPNAASHCFDGHGTLFVSTWPNNRITNYI